jgi:hypothetical protein
MGLAFMRFIWKVEPIASMTDDEIVTAIAPTIQLYLDGEVGSPKTRPTKSAKSAKSAKSTKR